MEGENRYHTQRNYKNADAIIKQYVKTKEEREALMARLRQMDQRESQKESIEEMGSLSLFDLAEEYTENELKFDGLSCGMQLLDDYLLGLKGGDVVVVGAYTGLGKSTTTEYWCMNMALQGYKVGLFAMEDNDREVGTRTVALWKGLGYKNGKDFKQACNGGNIHIFPMKAKYIFYHDKFAIIPTIEALVMTFGLKVICLDMLNDIIDPINDKDAEDFMVELKAACDKLDVIFITTARLREPKGITAKAQWRERYAPDEDSVYGKGLIKYLATKVVTIAPSATHKSTPVTGFSGSMMDYICFSVCKNRVGKITKKENVVLTYALERSMTGFMKFHEIGKEELTNDA